MKAGQQVSFFADEDAAEETAVITEVKAGEAPGPRILDLTVGEAKHADVEHESEAQPGAPRWRLKPAQQ